MGGAWPGWHAATVRTKRIADLGGDLVRSHCRTWSLENLAGTTRGGGIRNPSISVGLIAIWKKDGK